MTILTYLCLTIDFEGVLDMHQKPYELMYQPKYVKNVFKTVFH